MGFTDYNNTINKLASIIAKKQKGKQEVKLAQVRQILKLILKDQEICLGYGLLVIESINKHIGK
jgi:hypothetical protein